MGGGGGGGQGGNFPPKNLILIKLSMIIIITISHQIKPLAYLFLIKDYTQQSGGIKQILLKIRPKEFGVLNTLTHLLYFHPKFLSLDETLAIAQYSFNLLRMLH